MNLLIITRAYPPDQAVDARRWGRLASELSNLGHSITIVTRYSKLRKASATNHCINVVHLPIPQQPWPPRECTSTAYYCTSRIRSAIRKIFDYTLSSPVIDNTIIRWFLATLRCYRHLTKLASEADVIMATYGPSGPMWLGCYLSKKTCTPFLLDIRDSFDARRRQQSTVTKYLSCKLEDYIIKASDERITIGEKLSEYLETRHARSFHSIYNGWSENDLLDSSAYTSPNPKETKILYYAGRIYPHQLRSWDVLINALVLSPSWSVNVRLLKGDTEYLAASARQHRVSDRIRILPPTDQTTVTHELEKSDAALVFEDLETHKRPWATGTVTGKLIGLLASGKPGLAIAAPRSEIDLLVSMVPYWQRVHDSDDGARALADLAENNKCYSDKNSKLMELSMHQQALKVDSLIHQLRKQRCQK